MNPAISIVMPCFNASRWIFAAIESLRRQTMANFELIVVDDGSSDDSGNIIQKFQSSDNRIKAIHLERNGGIVNALNLGLDQATGRFIARMDADDICAPDRLARQLTFLEDHGIDLCGSWFREFGQGPSRIVRWPHSETALRAAMMFQNTICHPTLMARREVFEQYRYREEYRLVEDYDLLGRAMAKFRMANVPDALLDYRRHPQQATQAKRDAMEVVNQKIRIEVLHAQGIYPTPEEQGFHHQSRAPYSIRRVEDLLGIEAWLMKLHESTPDPEAKEVIASQWVRACIRAAPLGSAMWKAFRSSPLRNASADRFMTGVDIGVLAITRLDYRSVPFALLRRLGLSA